MPTAKGWRGRKDARSGEPAAIGDILQGLLSEDLFARGLPVGRLASRWPQIVGDRLAAETAPAALENGVLTVECSDGPWGAQAKFLGEQIRERADEALGGGVVRRVTVVVRRA